MIAILKDGLNSLEIVNLQTVLPQDLSADVVQDEYHKRPPDCSARHSVTASRASSR